MSSWIVSKSCILITLGINRCQIFMVLDSRSRQYLVLFKDCFRTLCHFSQSSNARYRQRRRERETEDGVEDVTVRALFKSISRNMNVNRSLAIHWYISYMLVHYLMRLTIVT